MKYWAALFPGVCTECDERISVGDMIFRTEDGYAHEECDRPKLTRRPTRFEGTSTETMGY